MTRPLLTLHQIGKKFPLSPPLFSHVDLTIHQGETVAIEGVSGTGKSTLLHCIAGLESPSEGSLFFEEIPITDTTAKELRKTSFGFIFQAYHLLEDLTPEENIALAMKIGTKKVDQTRISYLLEFLKIGHLAKKSCRYLSGGEKQRVAIARALANKPKLILADEPTASLDHDTSCVIEQLLFDLAKKEKTSLLIATHDRDLSKKCQTSYELSPSGLNKLLP